MKKSKKMILACVTILVFMAVYATSQILSTVNFKKPGGAFDVGTRGVEFTDNLREESSGVKGKRRLLIQFWYPAAHSETLNKAKYHPFPEAFNEDVARLFPQIPQVFLKRLSKSTTNALMEATLPANISSFPVILFSHGMDGMRFLSTYQMEELASHGYIVASIEHVYSASGTVFNDGTRGGVTPYELMEKEDFANKMVDSWSADHVAALNYLESINKQPDNFFYGKLNLEKVGLLGFSFGGCVVANTMVIDKRIKAGINLDGFYYGSNYTKGFEQPFMELRSQPTPSEKVTEAELKMSHLSRERWNYIYFEEWNKRLSSYARNGYRSYTVNGADHFSFCDMPLMAPVPWLLSPKTKRIHELTNMYTLAFFDFALKGIQSPLLTETKKLIK